MKQTPMSVLGSIGSFVAILVLFDLAVESAVHRSPILIPAGVASLAYLAFIILTWRRADPIAQFLIGLAGLAGVLACDGAQLGTLAAPGGVTLAGLPANTLAAGVVLAGMLVAVSTLAAARRVPLVAKLAVAFLAIFLAVPIALALVASAGYSGALATNAPLPDHPMWIDGAYLAALVFMPVAALAAIAAASIAVAAKRGAAAQRGLAAALAFALTAQMGGLEAVHAGFSDPIAFNPGTALGTTAATGTGAAITGAFSSPPPAITTGAPATAAAASIAAGAAGSNVDATSGDALAKICVPDPPAPGNVGAAAARSMTGVIGAFGGPSPTATPSPNPYAVLAQKYRHMAREIPCDSYNVDALAARLPNDPSAIDVFVRDHIALENYPGALRGASGTWMARSGNVVDRAILLSKLLAAKGIPSRFATATLADGDLRLLDAQRRVVPQDYQPSVAPDAPASSPADLNNTQDRDRAAALIAGAEQRTDKILASLTAGGVALSNDVPTPLEEFRHHVWVQVAKDGSLMDLDPSLSTLQPGKHLGATPGSATSDLPDDRYATMSVKLISEYGPDSAPVTSQLCSLAGHLADLGTKPVEIGVLPADTKTDFTKLQSETNFTAALGAGDSFTTSQPFSLNDPAHGKLRSLRIEIVTTQPERPSRTYVRWILAAADRNQPDLPLRIVGVRSLLVQSAPFSPSFSVSKALGSAATLAENAAHPDVPGNALAYPARALSFYFMDNALSPALGKTHGVSFQYARPRLAIEAWGFAPPDGAPVGTVTFDIVDNAMAAYGDRGAQANVALGVLDTELEHEALGPDAFGSLEALDANPSALTLLRKAPGDDGQYAGLQQSFDRGSVVLAMNAPVTLHGQSTWSWWDVDPNGGATVGRSTGGAGTEIGEYAMVLAGIMATIGSGVQAAKDCGSGSKACGCDIVVVMASAIALGIGGLAIKGTIATANALNAGGAVGLVGGAAQLCSGLSS